MDSKNQKILSIQNIIDILENTPKHLRTQPLFIETPIGNLPVIDVSPFDDLKSISKDNPLIISPQILN